MKTRSIPKLVLVLILTNLLFMSGTKSQELNVIPVNTDRNIILVTVKIGNVEVPKILFDTGLPFE